MKHHLFTSFYLILGLIAWVALVLLIPITIVGSCTSFITMLIFMQLGMHMLDRRVMNGVAFVFSLIGGFCFFVVMSILLFVSVYGKEFN